MDGWMDGWLVVCKHGPYIYFSPSTFRCMYTQGESLTNYVTPCGLKLVSPGLAQG